eukprot:sb/3478193/
MKQTVSAVVMFQPSFTTFVKDVVIEDIARGIIDDRSGTTTALEIVIATRARCEVSPLFLAAAHFKSRAGDMMGVHRTYSERLPGQCSDHSSRALREWVRPML